jgi:aryl-alcohol dehydrogenase-like predicted oxidoreductase
MLVDRLKVIAHEKQATPAQIALAWLLARKSWIVPIPGTRKRSRLEENIKAMEIMLTKTDMDAIEKIVTENPIEGERYGKEALKLINR